MPMRLFLQRNFCVIFYVAAAVAVNVAYYRLADGYLYNDDFRWMSQARYEMAPGNLFTFQVVGFFRPLMNVIFFVTERVMRGNIPGYYATNLMLHFLNGMLVFHLLERILRRRVVAAGAALFFLITSTHYSAVGWISARTTLVSTLLLLLSFAVLVGRPPTRGRQIAGVVLYMLALLAKEEAAIGVLLLALVVWCRSASDGMLPNRRSVIAFGLATIAYLIVRTTVMGHLTQTNWGPGPHVLRNLAGGFLYQLYPWSVAALTHVGRNLAAPTHLLWPEVLAIPAIILLIAAAARLKRRREVGFAVAWLMIAMLPMAPFRLRFFSTTWLTHDRYYYLSSIGACLAVVLLLDGLWQVSRARYVARATVVAVAIVVFIGEIAAVTDCRERFQQMTDSYRSLVGLVTQRLDADHEKTTCALEGWPMPPAFMHDVFALERPGWKIVPVHNHEEAFAQRPCLYVRLIMRGPLVTSVASTID